jgi:hypothetical protein
VNHKAYPDSYLRDILTSVRTIAVVGASPRRERPSHRVMAYLQQHGYRAIPVNPNAAGSTINGETVYRRLADVPEPIELVDCSAARMRPARPSTRRSRSAQRSYGCSSACATTLRPPAPKLAASKS